MKKLLQKLALGCTVLLVAGVVVVPVAQCDVRACVEDKIDAGADRIEAFHACLEEAKSERDAKIEEIKAEIEAKIAETKADVEAKISEVRSAIAERLSVMEEMHTCIEAAAIDSETATKEDVVAAFEDCAVQAGAISEEELAEIKAVKEEIRAKAEAILAEIEAKKAECEERKAIIDQCLDESFEGVDVKELGIEGIHTIMNDCLLEAGIDIEAIKQEIEEGIVAKHQEMENAIADKVAEINAGIEAAKQIHEEIEMCIDAIDFGSLDHDGAKEAIKACLPISDEE